eukprot:12718462-Alexandrium_andersonii.AAC.1
MGPQVSHVLQRSERLADLLMHVSPVDGSQSLSVRQGLALLGRKGGSDVGNIRNRESYGPQ